VGEVLGSRSDMSAGAVKIRSRDPS
jgi:hypothetical protein